YPSGQLLVWQTDDLPLARGASLSGVAAQRQYYQLLLDGQQRLTSLAAIMLNRELRVRDMWRSLDIVFNVYSEKFDVASPRQQGETGWISLRQFYATSTLAVWRALKISDSAPEADLIFDRLTRLDKMKAYEYRVVVLDNLSYQEVTDIFIRINSGGTTLGTADLALAQLSSRWRRMGDETGASEEFEQYQKQLWKQHGLWVGFSLFVRSMALLLTGQQNLGRMFHGERQNVTVDDLKAVWKRVQNGLNQAITFLEHNCYIDHFSLLPTQYILVTLMAYFDRFGAHISDADVRALQRWAYMAFIWSHYTGPLETRLTADYAALSKPEPIRALIQNVEDVAGAGRQVTERDLQDQRKNSPFMLMAYVLARRHGAADWFNGIVIGPKQPLELHHIFPKALLKERYAHLGASAASLIIDQVANLAILSAKANQRISSSAPDHYLPTIEAQRLKAQSIPSDTALWQLEQFETFARERRTMLATAINSLLLALTDKPGFWPIPETAQLNARVDGMEHSLRVLIVERLTEQWGAFAWEKGIPSNITKPIEKRVDKLVQENPFQKSDYLDLADFLAKCQFSDYGKIVEHNWPNFAPVFGALPTFQERFADVVFVRNALKHNNEKDLNPVNLASAEAGLLWLEECLRHYRLTQAPTAEEEVA
ncbi:MAG: DUF262 domain-containing protein, partial [Anaerolineae bacterium]|nr:DUF262 domain-containing protein [Anaerolineae bacterium]